MKNLKAQISNLKFIIAAVVCSVLSSSCEPQLSDDPIPFVAFNDVVMNLGLPEFTKLRLDGGFIELGKAGVRGVIVVRVNAATYRAYEKNCSFHPNEAASTIDMHVSGLFFSDASCGSTFNKDDGQPTGGPAWRPLRQYSATLDANVLTITDDVIN